MEISTENYLKTLFKLQESNLKNIKTNILSEKLQISPPAVSEMLKKLAEKGYIFYAPYQGASLTTKGLQIGRNIVRRHRILEMYLHQKLGYSWDKVHDEAEKLEHAASDTLIQRMEEALDFPEFDPHGDPIPNINGHMPPKQNTLLLAEGKKGSPYTIARVSDLDEAFLLHLDSLGLKLGKTITIKEILTFDHSFVIEINHKTHAISYFTAQHIWIKEVQHVQT